MAPLRCSYAHARIEGDPRFAPQTILGAPGCGKTERLLRQLEEELERGVPPERTAFVAFTRAARAEVRGRVRRRFGGGDVRFPWIRTVHSAAFRLIEARPDQVVTDERMAEFAARYGFDLSPVGGAVGAGDPDAEPAPSPVRTPDDLVRYAYDWGRNSCLTLRETLARAPVRGLATGRFDDLVTRYERFKADEGLLDFVDMLQQALEAGVRPPVEVAFIDEAQDLSPLQIAACERWFAPCVRVYVAGDDDQAIYGFQGASPAWLAALCEQRSPEILEQSHRLPAVV